LIRVIHGFRFLGTDNEHFPHELTVVATEHGFQYLYDDIPDEIANRRVNRVLDHFAEDKRVREEAGAPYNVNDYLQISQIGMMAYFFDSGDSYDESISLDDDLGRERVILGEARVKYLPDEPKLKGEGIDFTVVPVIKSLVRPPLTRAILEEVEVVLTDFPDLPNFINRFATVKTPGIIELASALVGSIDPTGPNAWFLNFVDGPGYFVPEELD